MKFCETCGNILMPRKRKSVLYCRVCQKDFPVKKTEDLKQYKRTDKTITAESRRRKREASRTLVVEENINTLYITEEERKAKEDMFKSTD